MWKKGRKKIRRLGKGSKRRCRTKGGGKGRKRKG